MPQEHKHTFSMKIQNKFTGLAIAATVMTSSSNAAIMTFVENFEGYTAGDTITSNGFGGSANGIIGAANGVGGSQGASFGTSNFSSVTRSSDIPAPGAAVNSISISIDARITRPATIGGATPNTNTFNIGLRGDSSNAPAVLSNFVLRNGANVGQEQQFYGTQIFGNGFGFAFQGFSATSTLGLAATTGSTSDYFKFQLDITPTATPDEYLIDSIVFDGTGTQTIANGTTTITSDLSTIFAGDNFSASFGSTTLDGNTIDFDNFTVVVDTIPEPSSAFLALLGLGLLAKRRR